MTNRGPETAAFTSCPRIWFRNTWSWGRRRRRRGPLLRERSPARSSCEHHAARPALAANATARPSCCSRRTRPTCERLFGAPNATPYVKDGINDYVVHGVAGRGESGAHRHQGRGALHRSRSIPGRRGPCACGSRARRAPPNAFGAAFDQRLRRPHPRSRRVLRHGHPRGSLRRTRGTSCGRRFAGHALVEAVLSLRRARLAEGRSGAPPPPAERLRRPQSRVDAPLQRRRHLHAGQVGISLVRRVGPGVPLRAAGAGRSRVRQAAAHADAARMVHASERAASRPMSGRSAT